MNLTQTATKDLNAAHPILFCTLQDNNHIQRLYEKWNLLFLFQTLYATNALFSELCFITLFLDLLISDALILTLLKQ